MKNDANNYPKCRYCGKPCDELDSETGAYWGWHTKCVWSDDAGRYGFQGNAFNNLIRAKEVADWYAQSNYSQYVFEVVDRMDGNKVVYSVQGKVRNIA